MKKATDAGFDVTCVIGHVSFTDEGDLSPVDAAFLLIAQHGTNGTFEFPAPDGGVIVVTVEGHTYR